MRPTKSITCPVCGRPNMAKDPCSFCGASLQEVFPPGAETQGTDPLAGSGPPAPHQTEGTGYPPPPPGPTQQWGEPSLAPKFAGFWIRTVAYMIDGFLILILVSVLVGVGVFGYISGSEKDAAGDVSYMFHGGNWNFLNVAVFLLNMVYFTFFLGKRGQTPGKRVCGLKVIRLDGSPVSYGQAAVRTLGYYLNHFTLCIGFLWVAIDPRKQGFHDKIAGTYEIRVGPAEVHNWQPPSPP